MGDDREVARTGATQVPTHAHQLKGGCSVAPPQVDRKGQPYYTTDQPAKPVSAFPLQPGRRKRPHPTSAPLPLSRVGFLEQGENKEEERATRRDFLRRENKVGI